ncbi:MAG: prepilin-type N-terminal cleavage/methylation domain-containing protein [Elusimicrobia bacterium]|nr:prepilin-type N-terminal cleavage/methylation domain-containing protein [Elusimicrobiota bacterium]
MRSPRGFSLVELLIAILLTSMVILGIAAVFSAVYRFHVAGYQRGLIQGGKTMSYALLARDIRKTTMFTLPNPPCPSGNCSSSTPVTCPTAGGPCDSDTLVGCMNLDGIPGSSFPATQVQRQDTNQLATAYQYCVDASGNMYYTSAQAAGFTCGGAACCPAAVTCGTALAGGTVSKIASQVRKDTAGGFSYYFRRPLKQNNLVEIHYSVGSGTATATVNTAVPAGKTFISPSP